jgi:hypothetical protein
MNYVTFEHGVSDSLPHSRSELEGKGMGQRTSLLIAGLAGVGLAGLVTILTGWLAALPIPQTVVSGLNHQSTLIFIFISVMLIDLPVMALSFGVGFVLFSMLRRATPALVLVCGAPWVLYCGYDILHAFMDMPNTTRMGLLSSLLSWSSVFTVPVGLFLASFLRGTGPSNDPAIPH